MKASIIIPVYNGQDTIEETIKSALAQDYSDFEVIVVDDGSTDHSWEAAEQFGSQITLISIPNGGVAKARNIGVSQATGDVILPLDADDVLYSSYLKKTTPLMVDGVAVVSTDMQYFGMINTVIYSEVSTPNFNGLPNTSLIRTRVFRELGGYDSAIVYEDWDLWLRIIKFGWSISILHEPLFLYRVGLNARNTMQDLGREKYRKEIRDRHV